MFSPIIRSHVNAIVSATKAITETHLAEKYIRIIGIIIRNTTAESITHQKQR